MLEWFPTGLVYIFIVLLVIILSVAIAIFFISIRTQVADDFPKIGKEFDPNEIKTGDLVSVGYRNPFGWFATLWTGSIWSHCGMAWRDPHNSVLYIIEAAHYPGGWGGVFKIPFDLWIRFNQHGYMSYTPLDGKKSKNLEKKIDRAFNKIKQKTLDSCSCNWARLLFKFPYEPSPNQTSYTCYELIVKLLQEVGIVKKKYMPASYFPDDLVFGRLDMRHEYKFKDPIYFDSSTYYDYIDM
jgi:hypothetical protein